MVQVQYKNTFADVLWLSAYTYSHSPVTLGVYSILLGFACFSVYTSVPDSTPLTARILTTAVIVAVFFAFVLLGTAGLVVLSLISKANRTILTQHTITLAETGLIEETEFNRTEQKWNGIPRLVRTRRHIFAYVAQHAAHVIPRRAFSDADSWDSFYKELQTRVQPSA